MIWIRRLLLGLIGLVVLLAVAAVVFVSMVDINRFKGLATDWVQGHYNRKLDIEGPIKLKLFPRLELQLSKVTLSEPAQQQSFARVDNADLSVALWPLVRGELEVGRVAVQGVQLNYWRDSQGRSNIDDLLKPTTADQANSKKFRWDVERIDVKDLQAQIKDELAQVQGDVVIQSLQTGRLAEGLETPIELIAHPKLKQPAVTGALTLKALIKPDTTTRSVSLRDMDFSFKGDAPGVKTLDTIVKGQVAWEGTQKALQAQNVSMILSGNLGSMQLKSTTIDLKQLAFDPNAQKIALQQLKVNVQGTVGQSTNMKASEAAASIQTIKMGLEWPALNVDKDQLRGEPFAGQLTISGGEKPLTASFKSGAPSGSFELIQLKSLDVTLNATGEQKISAVLKTDLSIRPRLGTVVLDALNLQAQLQELSAQPVKVVVQGKAEASAQQASWRLNGQINGNPLETDGIARFDQRLLNLQVQARFDALDVNSLTGKNPANLPPSAPTIDAPVNLRFLHQMEGEFNIQASRLVYEQYQFRDFKLQSDLRAGVLRVNQLSGKSWGGQIATTGVIDARNQRMAFKGNAAGVNVNGLLKDVANKDILEGVGQVNFDINTVGSTVNQLKAALNGEAALQLRDGSLKGINLAKSFRQAKATLTMREDAVQKSNQVEKTDFSELGATFQINNGIALSRDLSAKSPFFRLGGEGQVNIPNNTIDYILYTTVTDTSKGQGGAELAMLKGITVPVLLSGPFDALGWRIQWSKIATSVLTDKVKERLTDKLGQQLGLKSPAGAASSASSPAVSAENSKEALKNAVRDRLKGLLK
jgi:AsmA protein